MSDDLNRLKERLEKDPDSLLFAQYADLLRKNGKVDEAIEIAEKGVGKHNEYATGFLVLGRCFKEKKAMENAIKHLEIASKLDKQSILALKELSELYRDLNDKINAKKVLNRLLELDPLDREAKGMLREIEEKELKEEEGVEEEGLSSYFESAEYEAEEEELVVEEDEIAEKPKTSFEEIDFEEIPKEEKETELKEVLDEEEVEVEEVTEEEIKSMFAFDEEVGKEVAEEEERKEAAPEEELVEVFEESEGFPAEEEPEEEVVRTTAGEEEDKEEKIEEEVEFEDVFGKEEVSKEEEEEEERIFDLGGEVEALDVVEKEKEGIEGEEVAPTLPTKEEVSEEIEESVEEEVIEEVTTETAKGREVLVEGAISLELAEIYQRRGFNSKALEAYKRLYEQSKDEEIKKRIDELEGKIKARDLSANKEEAGGEGIFSQLDKKAPIEKEGFKKEEEISKKPKGEEEERDKEFKDWIDGLSGT